MSRWRVPAVAALLGLLLVAGGATALASRADRPGPPPVPAEGPGPEEVQLSPYAADHPAADAVREQLQRHYEAINERDYTGWAATVVPARAEALPESEWQAAYASTRDGSIHVARIDTEPDGGLLVRVRFISTQDLADAPPDLAAERICWHSTLPMRGAPPRIDRTGGGSSAREAC